jgi:DNA-binding SARP family transcriptional activator/tetratricopeptide (TPR) repeat protein
VAGSVSGGGDVRVRILGEFEVLDAELRPIKVGGRRQRALLALLATRPSEVVSADRLVDALWGNDPPANAPNALQTVVSRLRRAVGDDRVLTRPPGYVLAISGADVDAICFEQLADEGRRALAGGDAARAGEKLRAALDLWSGAPLAEFAGQDFASLEAARLEDRRLAAMEDRIEADLGLGRHADVVEEVSALAGANPLRERLQAQHLIALYRTGRQAEALARYREVAAALREEHGLEPGKGLRELERRMLRQDPALDPPRQVGTTATPRPPGGGATAGAPVRRLVSVVYVELEEVAGTAGELDPERLHAAQRRIFEELGAVMERHGGVIERLPGDDAVATFGFDQSHEDDAGRAVRAAGSVASAVAQAVDALGGDVRAPPSASVGVASGEVIAGDDSILGARVVRTARSLARSAAAGEVLVDARTADLARHGAEYERVTSGERVQLARFRLRSPPGYLPSARPLGTAAFVNREQECAALARALDAAVGGRRAHVVTVLGPPGIGKSRLVYEFTSSVAGRARVVGGRCLSYGEGTSVFALSGVVWGMVGEDVEVGLATRLAGVERGEQIAARVSAAVGAGGQGGPAEEIQWAVRRLLECVASDRPLVVRLDDVHWAEPWLLDLVEYLAAFAVAPFLVVMCARTDELRDIRADWTRPGVPGDVLELESLSSTHTHELVSEMLVGRSAPPGAAEQIAVSSGGNPLFAEQVVALEVARGFAGARALPDTLLKLLQERIDHLEADERELLARAAVEGVVFHRRALAALADDTSGTRLGAAAMSLMRKGFITTADSDIPGEDAFRFHHMLLQNAAYEALPKERRARMHVRLADWMERAAPHSHEVIGHHLHETWRFMGELGVDESTRHEVGRRGADQLREAAEFAAVRSALPAAVELRRQAAAMLPERSRNRVRVLVELGDVLLTSGRLEEAARTLAEGGEIALAIGDAHGAAHASVLGLQVALQADAHPPLERIPAVSAAAARTFRRRRDDLGMCRVYHTRALAHWFAGRCRAAGDAWEHAAEHARVSGLVSALPDMLAWIASAVQVGPEPVPAAIVRCVRILDDTPNYPWWQAFVRRQLALLYAMRGEFERSRAVFAECRQVLDEMSETIHSAVRDREAEAALLEGDAARAERVLRASMDRLQAMGDRFMLSYSASLLARSVEAQVRADEAYDLTFAAERRALEGDSVAQVSWRLVRARILAGRGAVVEAERIAREAVTLAASTDWLVGRGDAALALGITLRAQQREDEADRAFRRALNFYERKEATVMAEACRTLMVAQPERQLG